MYTTVVTFLQLLLGVLVSNALAAYDIEEDVRLDTIGLLEKYGYPAERHYVTTEDGYILGLHRIPHSPETPPLERLRPRRPILLQHGILSSSADWVAMGPGESFAYLLSDAGYDVWLGNCRGNTYSRNHTTLNASEPDFWRFSFHEIGVYDLSAMIDYVLRRSGAKQLFYAGHSMGTTSFFVLCAERPEYNDKVRAMFAMAPVVYMHFTRSPFLLQKTPLGKLLFEKSFEFLPSNELITQAGERLCHDSSPLQPVCANILFLIAGYDSKELNETMLPVILSHTPAGASSLIFAHYHQMIESGKFRKIDYGLKNNPKVYGTWTPPEYALNRVTVPIVLLYSVNDLVSGSWDVELLCKKVPGCQSLYKVPFKKFNHIDYLWAIHAKEYIYDVILCYMKFLSSSNEKSPSITTEMNRQCQNVSRKP